MDGLSPAKQNGGQAPSDLIRRLAFSIGCSVEGMSFY